VFLSCTNTIYSPSSGLIWTLKVPMDLLSPGGGNKIICKVTGQEIKIFYYYGPFIQKYYLPSISCPFVFLSCTNAIYSPSSGLIWTLKVPMDLCSLGGGNKIICKVTDQEIKIFIIKDLFFKSTTYLAFHVRLCFCHVQTLSTPPVLVWFEL
jgi:hypothetical protein